MPLKKNRDFPLSPTQIDNTKTYHVSLNDIKYMTTTPTYSYKNKNYSSKDSSLYKKGFDTGMYETKTDPSGSKTIGGTYKKGFRAVGLSDEFNSGFSEGKDRVLSNK